MARAKQTNRAEARRRYRQTLVQPSADSDASDDSEPVDGGTSAATRPAPTASGRPSIGAAFRGAYHGAHYREDLRALPGLLTLTQPTRIPLTRSVVGIPWFLVSALLVIIGFAALAIEPGQGALLFQLFSLPPGGPTLPVLLVGFMATRASYMQGFLIGLIDLVLIGIYVALVPSAAGQTNVPPTEIMAQAAITGLPTSILFAAAAAWYRRFLALSSPKRMPPPRGGGRGRQSSRPATRR